MTGQAKGDGKAGVAEVEAFLKAHPDIEAAEALVSRAAARAREIFRLR